MNSLGKWGCIHVFIIVSCFEAKLYTANSSKIDIWMWCGLDGLTTCMQLCVRHSIPIGPSEMRHSGQKLHDHAVVSCFPVTSVDNTAPVVAIATYFY